MSYDKPNKITSKAGQDPNRGLVHETFVRDSFQLNQTSAGKRFTQHK